MVSIAELLLMAQADSVRENRDDGGDDDNEGDGADETAPMHGRNGSDNGDNQRFPKLLRSMQCGYLHLLWLVGRMRPRHGASSYSLRSRNARQGTTATAGESASAATFADITLPKELCVQIVSFFVVQPVDPSQVAAVDASSSDRSHPLRCVLDVENESTWWISAPGSMPRGKGREWLQFKLGPKLAENNANSARVCPLRHQPPSPASSLSPSLPSSTPSGQIRRLTAVHIKIPPLPMGPLSVRDCHLEALRLDDTEKANSIDRNTVLTTGPDWYQVSPVWKVENRSGLQRFELPHPLDTTDVRLVCRSNQFSSITESLVDIARLDMRLGHMGMVGLFAVKLE